MTSFFGAEVLGGLGLGEGMTMTEQLGTQVQGLIVVAAWSLAISWIGVAVIRKPSVFAFMKTKSKVSTSHLTAKGYT